MKKYDSYKDSGIEWIGEIPSHWNVKKLKFISKICNGQDQKAVLDDNGIYPVFGSGGVFGKANSFLFDKPSVLLGRKGTIDKPQYVEEPFWTVDTSYYTKIHEGFSVRLFYYLCTTINFELYKYGSAIPSMTQGHLNEIKFAIPKSFDEQVILANYLDHKTTQIDHLIAKKEQFIQLLDEERVAVINQAVTKGLDPTITMKDSGIEWLGETPAHWEVYILKHILNTTKGFAFKSDQFIDKGVPIVKASDIKNKTIRLETTHFISEENAMEFNHVKLSTGDILISTVGSTPDVVNSAVGQIGKVPIELDGALLNQNTVRLEVSDKNSIFSEYLFLIIQNENYRIHLNLNAHGTANQASLKLVDLLSYKVALPPLNEQLTIIKHNKEEDQRIQTIIKKTHQEIELLKEYKTALISEVVTGKVDVREEKMNQQVAI
jgi:type I restriction enzyme S subunit